MRDREIREALRPTLGVGGQGASSGLVVDEFGLCEGEALVDVLVIGDLLHGYEIKSDRDSLDRLPRQREVYNRTLERVTIVAASLHLRKIEALVPAWWGLVEAAATAEGDVLLAEVRAGEANPAIDPYSVARLLWRDEVLAILEQRGLARSVRGKPRAALWRRLVEVVDPQEVCRLTRARLVERIAPRAAALAGRCSGAGALPVRRADEPAAQHRATPDP